MGGFCLYEHLFWLSLTSQDDTQGVSFSRGENSVLNGSGEKLCTPLNLVSSVFCPF